jgi:hypothetical protein
MTEADTPSNFTDADLKAAMRRTMRMTVALAIFGFGVLFLVGGWQNGVAYLIGAAIAATGLYEWQQLIAVINAKLDNKKAPRSTGFVLIMLFLRLGVAAAAIYVSLKCFRGSPYALVGGLGLVAVTLLIEAIRQVRS